MLVVPQVQDLSGFQQRMPNCITHKNNTVPRAEKQACRIEPNREDDGSCLTFLAHLWNLQNLIFMPMEKAWKLLVLQSSFDKNFVLV